MTEEKKPLILKLKVMDMLDYMNDRLNNFPKKEWRGLSARIQDAGYKMLEITADIGNGFYTMANLSNFDKEKNRMEAYLEYALRRKYITNHQYMTWGGMVTELGKINGGLTNALKLTLQQQGKPPAKKRY